MQFNKEFIFRSVCPLYIFSATINNKEICKQLANMIYDSCFLKLQSLLKDFLKDINNIQEQVTDYANILKTPDIDKINIEVGEHAPCDQVMFHQFTHTDQYIPIIYINGNIVEGKQIIDKINGRIHHSELFKEYCKNMKLHKYDKNKKMAVKWLQLIKGDIQENMNINKCVRAVRHINGKAVAIVLAFGNSREAADAFIQQLLGCKKVFVIIDDASELQREAKHNRLMRKIT